MTDQTTESNSNTRPSRIKTWLKRLAFLSFGTAFGLGIAEVGLILLGVNFLLPYEPDQHCGTRLRPNLSGRYIKEGQAYFSINSFGHRDIERPQKKPSKTIRIAVLGDSYAEAMQVERDQAFWSILEDKLNDTEFYPGMKVEVLNFGVSGYGTAQELQMLRHYVWQFEPDVVLLAFLSGNDLMDNSPEIGPKLSRPYFQIQGDDLVLDDSFLTASDYLHALKSSTKRKVNIINASRLMQVVNEVKSNLERQSSNQDDQPTLDELGLDPFVYEPPSTKEYERAWQLTEAILEQMSEEVEAHRAAFAVVSLSNAIQVDPKQSRRDEYCTKRDIDDLFYPDKRILEICERLNVPCLALAPKMAETAIQDEVYYHGFENTQFGMGHWNVAGHGIAGELIFQAMRKGGDLEILSRLDKDDRQESQVVDE